MKASVVVLGVFLLLCTILLYAYKVTYASRTAYLTSEMMVEISDKDALNNVGNVGNVGNVEVM